MAKTDKENALNRVQVSKARRPQLHKPYIAWHPTFPNTIEAVFCKLCRTKIRGMIEDERFRETRLVNDVPVPHRMLVMACLGAYEEITIEFDDGSAHVTPVCKTCAGSLTVQDLEDIYAADLAQFAEDETRGHGTAPWRVYAHRVPTGYKRAK